MKKTTFAFILITSLFFMWGLASNMTDTLLAAFKRILSLSDFQTSFVQSAFYGAYFFLALPAAMLIKRFSYKTGILIGLGLFVIGSLLFYPASISIVYEHFLIALFILAGGLAILETAANPYILELGPTETATQRLNLAQSFNPIGAISGGVLSKYFILSGLNIATDAERSGLSAAALQEMRSVELTAVMGPYVGVALVLMLLWLLIAFTHMPKSRDNQPLYLGAALGRLLKNRNYTSAVMAQFFYIGAQVGVWSFTIRYVMQELSLKEAEAASYYIAGLIVFLVFRFVFTYLMQFYSPARLLSILAVLAAVLTVFAIYGSGVYGVIAVIVISACMSLMFPTIFGLGLDNVGEDAKLGSAGMVMAIVGGALLTTIQGRISDMYGDVKMAFFVPFVCFIVVAVFGHFASRRSPTKLQDQPLV